MPPHELLIGAPEFWARARTDIAAARSRVLVQAMTFEGDATGQGVAEAIMASPAARRAVAVDDYSRWVVNDRWVHTRRARADPQLQAEVRATAAMFEDLQAGGVEVTWTEPIRRLWRDYPFRNHRKMIVADGVAYLGGVNFSEHNFAWSDVMVRIARPDVADRLAADFPTPGSPSSRAWRADFGGLTLYALDGRSNDAAFRALMAELDQARETIVVVSPYLTFPFTDALIAARRRGVRVSVVTPHRNNKPLLHDYIDALSRRAGFELVQTAQMSHAKALIVDGARVTLGSSNFDFVSYDAEPEIIVSFDDPVLARALDRGLVQPARAGAVDARRVSAVAGALATAKLRLAQGYVRVLKRVRGSRHDD